MNDEQIQGVFADHANAIQCLTRICRMQSERLTYHRRMWWILLGFYALTLAIVAMRGTAA